MHKLAIIRKCAVSTLNIGYSPEKLSFIDLSSYPKDLKTSKVFKKDKYFANNAGQPHQNNARHFKFRGGGELL